MCPFLTNTKTDRATTGTRQSITNIAMMTFADLVVGLQEVQSCARTADDCWRITLHAPSNSPYSGAMLLVDAKDKGSDHAALAWTFRSEIYHPLFRKDQPLCTCMTSTIINNKRVARDPHDVIDIISRILIEPFAWPTCDSCVVDAQAKVERSTDLKFFNKKARTNTPGSYPLSDDELRSTTTDRPDFSTLLKTGAYSDIKLVCGKTSFSCHRTILAARSGVFKHIFATSADNGSIAIKHANPCSVARFLKFIYCDKFPMVSELTPEDHAELCGLAYAYRVEPLYAYTCGVLEAIKSVDTACTLVVTLQKFGCVPLLSKLCKFFVAHISSISSHLSWSEFVNSSGPARRVITMALRSQVDPQGRRATTNNISRKTQRIARRNSPYKISQHL